MRVAQVLLYPEEGWARNASSSYWTITPCRWWRRWCVVEEISGSRQYVYVIYSLFCLNDRHRASDVFGTWKLFAVCGLELRFMSSMFYSTCMLRLTLCTRKSQIYGDHTVLCIFLTTTPFVRVRTSSVAHTNAFTFSLRQFVYMFMLNFLIKANGLSNRRRMFVSVPQMNIYHTQTKPDNNKRECKIGTE